MKENMQKTPLVQEKAKKYHDKEEIEAEKLLEDIHDSSIEDTNENVDENENKKLWFFARLKALFK